MNKCMYVFVKIACGNEGFIDPFQDLLKLKIF